MSGTVDVGAVSCGVCHLSYTEMETLRSERDRYRDALATVIPYALYADEAYRCIVCDQQHPSHAFGCVWVQAFKERGAE